MKNKLTKKEQQEQTLVTVGRLRGAIKYGSKERQLVLLEKIAQDIEEMEEYEAHLVNTIKEQEFWLIKGKYDIFNLMRGGETA